MKEDPEDYWQRLSVAGYQARMRDELAVKVDDALRGLEAEAHWQQIALEDLAKRIQEEPNASDVRVATLAVVNAFGALTDPKGRRRGIVHGRYEFEVAAWEAILRVSPEGCLYAPERLLPELAVFRLTKAMRAQIEEIKHSTKSQRVALAHRLERLHDNAVKQGIARPVDD